MPVTISQLLQYVTPQNTLIWDSQPSCSISFWFRPEITGAVVGQTQYVLGRAGSYSLSVRYAVTSVSGTGGTANLTTFIKNASNALASKSVTINLGTIYHVAITYSQGAQTVYVNAVPTVLGSLTGNTQTANVGWTFGGGAAGSQLSMTLGDIAVWNGYALTQSDIMNLMFGVSPSQIGLSATWFGEWSLAGTVGATPTIGDSWLKCAPTGTVNADFATTNGAGSVIYSSPLTSTINAELNRAYVGTSGKTVACLFNVVGSSDTLTTVSVCQTPPTLYRNGANVGQLVNPWITGYHNCVVFGFPPGVSAALPTDSFTISAPNGWLVTGAGVVAGLSSQPVTNLAGKSVVGSDTMTRTLRPGMNFGWYATGAYNSSGWLTKNMAPRMASWVGAASLSADNIPLTLTSTSATVPINSTSTANGIDNLAYPGRTGYYAVGWDTPAPGGTTFALTSGRADTTVITEVTELRNPGDGSGKGQVRVFDVQYVANPVSMDLNIKLTVTDTTRAPSFSNLLIYPPGDFTYQANTPVVLENSDRCALNSTLLSRLQNGVGSIRCMDSTLGAGGASDIVEPEQLRLISDFCWSTGNKETRQIGLTTARPWDDAAYPYIYTKHSWGSPYTATLAAAITTAPVAGTTETITISDAQAAPTAPSGPVLPGLKLQIGSEVMRVLGVSGTSVTVERGSEGTTPATHPAGTITVNGRLAVSKATFGTSRVAQMVSQSPHGLQSGQAPKVSGTWPTLTWTDGGTGSYVNYKLNTYVTGPDTYLIVNGGTTTNNTLTTTFTLTPASSYVQYQIPPGAVPYQFLAKFAASFDKCNLHVNLGFVMSNTCIDAVARIIRDNFPAGREVWIEYTNEPWNVYMGAQYPYLALTSKFLAPSGFGFENYVKRSSEIRERFINIFNEGGRNRGVEVHLMLNIQRVAPTTAANCLAYAQANNYVIDGIGIAPYLFSDASIATQTAWWRFDDDQAVDLWIHDLWYNTNAGSVSAQVPLYSAMLTNIQQYNASTGNNCVLYGYEGGLERTVPETTTTLSSAIDNQTTSVPVASAAGMVVGEPIVVDADANQELMFITAISGNTLTVQRGQAGLALVTAQAVAHASGASVRSCAKERDQDIMYNPNFRQAELDVYALWQRYFRAINVYSFMYNSPPQSDWSFYYGQGQLPGKGDGSDGLADNRLSLCCPGKANTKAATISHHRSNVSVRGQAYLDWMKSDTTQPQPPPQPRKRRPRFCARPFSQR